MRAGREKNVGPFLFFCVAASFFCVFFLDGLAIYEMWRDKLAAGSRHSMLFFFASNDRGK